jgi:DNA relaxase NicK
MLVDTALSVVHSGYDWCTMTAKRGERADSLHERASLLLEKQAGSGNKVKLVKWGGYHGKSSGGVRFGVRHDGCILVLSSAAAAAHTVESIPLADNVSRIDLQVTCFDASTQAERAHMAYYSMLEAPRRRGRPPSASLRLNSGGGQTLYAGSRSSDKLGRLYDYGIAHKKAPAGTYWRFEMEYKREEALRLAVAAIERQLDDAIIAALVVDYFAQRGIPAPACHEDIAAVIDGHRATLEFDGLSDADRTLRWLTDCVRQSVRRLIDSGRLSDVVRALGLEEAEGLAPSPPPPINSEED